MGALLRLCKVIDAALPSANLMQIVSIIVYQQGHDLLGEGRRPDASWGHSAAHEAIEAAGLLEEETRSFDVYSASFKIRDLA